MYPAPADTARYEYHTIIERERYERKLKLAGQLELLDERTVLVSAANTVSSQVNVRATYSKKMRPYYHKPDETQSLYQSWCHGILQRGIFYW